MLDGWCVVIRIHPGAEQTLADARENLAATAAMCAGKRWPLLSDISRGVPLDPEVRHFYSGKQLTDHFVAQSLVVEATPFGRVVGNVYLRVARPGIPTRLFSSEPDALAWLRTFVS